MVQRSLFLLRELALEWHGLVDEETLCYSLCACYWIRRHLLKCGLHLPCISFEVKRSVPRYAGLKVGELGLEADLEVVVDVEQIVVVAVEVAVESFADVP